VTLYEETRRPAWFQATTRRRSVRRYSAAAASPELSRPDQRQAILAALLASYRELVADGREDGFYSPERLLHRQLADLASLALGTLEGGLPYRGGRQRWLAGRRRYIYALLAVLGWVLTVVALLSTLPDWLVLVPWLLVLPLVASVGRSVLSWASRRRT